MIERKRELMGYHLSRLQAKFSRGKLYNETGKIILLTRPRLRLK